jgi:hypothetical protein
MSRRIRTSRLNRNAEKQSRKQFILFGIGTVIIIFLLIQFSGSILSLFGNIIFGIRGDENQLSQTNQIDEVLFAPSLNNIPNATSSAQIDISGTASYEDGRIILYINDREVDSTKLGNDQSFTFKKVSLRSGENRIKVYYSINNRQSDFSQEYVVIRSSEKLELEITSPSDGTTFKKADKRINVSGKTDPNSSVSVNGFRAVVNSEGEFSYLLELNEGDNKIIVESTNEAGIKVQKEITVKYENG